MVSETLISLTLREWNGNIAVGILIIANVTKPIVNSTIIRIHVKNHTRLDFM